MAQYIFRRACATGVVTTIGDLLDFDYIVDLHCQDCMYVDRLNLAPLANEFGRDHDLRAGPLSFRCRFCGSLHPRMLVTHPDIPTF